MGGGAYYPGQRHAVPPLLQGGPAVPSVPGYPIYQQPSNRVVDPVDDPVQYMQRLSGLGGAMAIIGSAVVGNSGKRVAASGVTQQDDPIQRLMAQLDLPQGYEPKPPTITQKVLASLSDALMNYAAVISGGGPVGTPQQDRLRAGQQQERQRADEATSERRSIKNQLVLRQEEAKSKAAADADKYSFEAYKKGLDLGADLAKKKYDEAVADRKAAIELWNESIEDPEFAASVPKGFDISKASLVDVSNLRYEHLVRKGVPPEEAKALVALDTLTRTRPDLVQGKRKNISIDEKGKTSVSLVEPAPAGTGGRGRELTVSGLSPEFLARKSQEIGESLFQDDLETVNRKLAAFGKERLRWVKLNATETKELTAYDMLVQGAEELLDDIEASGVGGAENFFFATSDEAAAFRVKALNLRDIMERARTGATTNASDKTTYDTLFAAMGNLTRNNVAALKHAIEFFGKFKRQYMRNRGVPESQMRAMRMQEQSGLSESERGEAGQPELPEVDPEFSEGP